MRDYRVDKNDQEKYIDYYEDDGSISIHFADGSIYENVDSTSENIAKLEKLLNEQANEALNNYDDIRKNKNHLKVATYIWTILSGCGSYFALNQLFINDDRCKLIAGCGAGTVALTTSIISYLKLVRGNELDLLELDKIRYLKRNYAELSTYKNCANSLVGLSDGVKKFFETNSNPFSLNNINNYSLNDLEIIMENLKFQDKVGLSYKKVHKKK